LRSVDLGVYGLIHIFVTKKVVGVFVRFSCTSINKSGDKIDGASYLLLPSIYRTLWFIDDQPPWALGG
jgi:hypothetical protein